MSDRKLDHIGLAFESQTGAIKNDNRFIYEPLLAGHPKRLEPVAFMPGKLQAPVWASSMTGGTALAKKINENIARVCKDFGMGMGLGSCRIILEDDTYFEDFNVRKFIGDQPLYANLGIAQAEILWKGNKLDLILRLIDKLKADGLIIHVNPLQEVFQPEGNEIQKPPVNTIEEIQNHLRIPLIVKEVGQGFGGESLKRLLQLPLEAIEFGAFGGTNFSLLEMKRGNHDDYEIFEPFAFIGQTAEQMVDSINKIITDSEIKCRQVIISGGIKSFLDGFYLMQKCKLPSVYGQASAILQYAKKSYEDLYHFVEMQVKGLSLAQAYLKINPAIV